MGRGGEGEGKGKGRGKGESVPIRFGTVKYINTLNQFGRTSYHIALTLFFF